MKIQKGDNIISPLLIAVSIYDIIRYKLKKGGIQPHGKEVSEFWKVWLERAGRGEGMMFFSVVYNTIPSLE